jgi:hypothetical protein
MKYEQPFANPDPNASYINAQEEKGIHGSIPGGPAVENPMREITNLITNSLQTPTDDDLMQVTRGVRDGRLNFRVDQGTANQIVVDQLSPSITSYDAGLEVRVLVAHTATGPTTIQIGNLAAIGVTRLDGTALKANDLLAGQIADLVCDGTQFQVQNLGVADQAGGGNIDRYEVLLPYIHDTGTVNHLIGLYVPALPNINEGRTVEIKLANNTTGPVDFKPNNFPVYPVRHPDGSELSSGDGVSNQIFLLCFDGGQWQLISSRSDPNAVIVRTPKRSLQFQDPNAGWWGTYTSFPFLMRTPKAAGNSNVWTFSAFIRWPVLIPRPNVVPGNQTDLREFVLSAADATGPASGGASDVTCLEFEGGDVDTCLSTFWHNTTIPITGYGDSTSPVTHNGIFKWGVFKDTNWHHLMWRADAITAHQTEVWVDGILVNAGSVTSASTMNAARLHALGTETGPDNPATTTPTPVAFQPSVYGCRARMAEVCMVDGQWLDWSFFAYNIGGIMIPKVLNVPAMNFGTNGYYLNWADGTAMTSTTLGTDYSPNKNDWTPVNFTAAHLHLDYPGNPDSTETFGTFTNGGTWPTGLPPGWRTTSGP